MLNSEITLKLLELKHVFEKYMLPSNFEIALDFNSWLIILQQSGKDAPRDGVLDFGKYKVCLKKEDMEKFIDPFFKDLDALMSAAGS